MNLYAPDYYKEFKCIADKCSHNCCIGWEIDIDSNTYEKYKCVVGEFGKKLKRNISTEGEPHFILEENDRCPFLNKHNLCDIIINLGEEHLCGICNDHPRYRNFFSDREEMGLGLCCEAAAELILNRTEKVKLVKISGNNEIPDEDEREFFNERDNILTIVQNRDITVMERIHTIIDKYNISFPYQTSNEWAGFLKGLERLDNVWDEKISKFAKFEFVLDTFNNYEIISEQLVVYFILRHLADGMYDSSIRERLAFAIVSTLLIIAISVATGEKPPKIARMYSSEIEYSDDNMEIFFGILN